MQNDDTLYHYCSTDAFVSIISNQSIRLSSLKLSNDSMEGRHVMEVIADMAANDGLDSAKVQRLKDMFVILLDIDALAFCLSEHGDLLSQWRGYADDGQGVSIGFSRQWMLAGAQAHQKPIDHSMMLSKVVYGRASHVDQLKGVYSKLRDKIFSTALEAPLMHSVRQLAVGRSEAAREEFDADVEAKQRALVFSMLELFPQLFQLKAQAFAEESEWRLFVNVVTTYPDERLQFRSGRNRVIPFRTLSMKEHRGSLITEVILGPKHDTPAEMVRAFLQICGFQSATVRRSVASYR